MMDADSDEPVNLIYLKKVGFKIKAGKHLWCLLWI